MAQTEIYVRLKGNKKWHLEPQVKGKPGRAEHIPCKCFKALPYPCI